MSQELVRPGVPRTALLHVNHAPPSEGYRSLLVTLFKWKWLILGLGFLLATATAITMMLQPVVWSAAAKILLKMDRVPLQIPGLGFSRTGSRGSSLEELTTEMEFLESASVLLPVARALAAARGEHADVLDSDLRGAVDQLRARLIVAPVPNTTVLQVTYLADSRTEAERTLGLIVDHYIEKHALAYSGGARLTTFYERELEVTGESLRQTEERFREWREANNIATLDGQIDAQIALRAGVEKSLKRTEVEIGGARAAIATLAGQVAAQPERAVASRQLGSNPMIAKLKVDLAAAEAALREAPQTPLVTRLKGELITAQIALNDLRQRYRDPERRVEEKKEQIALIEREIANAERDAARVAVERVTALKAQLADAERAGDVLVAEMVATNPLREALARELAGTQARLTSLQSQADALRGQLTESENAVGAVQAKRADYERLSRDVERAKALYVANGKRLDDSRIVARLEKEELSTVAVLERPRATGGRSPKRQLMIVAMAGAVGLGLGVAVGFAAELLNGTLRTPQEAEFYLGIPVVATIPAIAGARPMRAIPLDVHRSSHHPNS